MKKITLIALALALTGCLDWSQEAETLARTWCVEMGMKDAKVTCVRADSDGDGYVSCTVMHEGKPLALECSPGWVYDSGCRVPKLNINGSGR